MRRGRQPGQRQALRPGPVQPPQAREQQLAGPARLVIEAVAVAEFGDVGVDQPHLAARDFGIAFGDRPLAEAQRFHLGALQRDPRLEHLVDGIVEARAPVFGDDLLLVEFGGGLRTGHE